MATTTVRIPEETRDTLKIIASIEKREIKEIVTELINEYIERHRETLELLSKPEWVEAIKAGKEEVKLGTKGKALDELED
jgi:predicted transcriptional regulator